MLGLAAVGTLVVVCIVYEGISSMYTEQKDLRSKNKETKTEKGE